MSGSGGAECASFLGYDSRKRVLPPSSGSVQSGVSMHPEDGRLKLLRRNVGNYLPTDIALYPRRLEFLTERHI